MGNECHFCRGIVSVHETGEFLLDGHADHRVYLHEQCAAGHGLVDRGYDALQVTCPECGTVETV